MSPGAGRKRPNKTEETEQTTMQNGIRKDLMKRKVQRIHFVGIGGIGMSGIAEKASRPRD